MKRKRTSVCWTDREEALICRLRERGCDSDEIAAKPPGRTLIAVQRRVAHLIALGRISSFRAPWSAEEDALLGELLALGLSTSAMVAHFTDRTRDAIDHQIRQLRQSGRLGNPQPPAAPRPPWTDSEESLLVEMRTDGAKLGEIAAKLRRSPRAVAARAHALIDADELERAATSPLSQRRWSTEEDQLVAVMRRAGKSAKEIAATLDRTVPSVCSHIDELVRKGELGLVRKGSATTTNAQTRRTRQ